jgi:hypothetical protein
VAVAAVVTAAEAAGKPARLSRKLLGAREPLSRGMAGRGLGPLVRAGRFAARAAERSRQA